MPFIVKLVINSISIFLASALLPGVFLKSYPTAIWVALVISLLNAFIKPLLIILTIPITIFTFGIFLFLINAIIFSMAAYLINGFAIEGFFTAVILSLIVSILNYLMESPGMKRKKDEEQVF
jgi:putative membrane protein